MTNRTNLSPLSGSSDPPDEWVLPKACERLRKCQLERRRERRTPGEAGESSAAVPKNGLCHRLGQAEGLPSRDDGSSSPGVEDADRGFPTTGGRASRGSWSANDRGDSRDRLFVASPGVLPRRSWEPGKGTELFQLVNNVPLCRRGVENCAGGGLTLPRQRRGISPRFFRGHGIACLAPPSGTR